MSVYPPNTLGPFFMMDIIFRFLSHRVTLRWNIISSKGKEAILLIASCYWTPVFNAPTSDGPLGSNAKSIFLL